MDDVTAVIENPTDILRIDCARQMGITVMPTIITVRCHFQKFIAEEELRPDNFWILFTVLCEDISCGLIGCIGREIGLDFGFAGFDFFCEKILLIEK